MYQMDNEYIQEKLANVALNSNCKKRHVGCMIIDHEGTIVAMGYNFHENGICDCESAKTAMHAEIMAVNNIPIQKREYKLHAYVNHKPCERCTSILNSICEEVTVYDSNVKLKEEAVEEDPVNPSHYADIDGVPSIRFFESATTPEGFKGYLQLNAIKYLYRLDSKDQPLVNVRKAKWFITKLEEHLDGEK